MFLNKLNIVINCTVRHFFIPLHLYLIRYFYIMCKANKILFITQEIKPYLQESEMSEIGRNLPQNIQESGKEIRTFMPKWGNINERRNQLHEVIRLSGMNIIIDDTDHPLIIKVASIQAARMQVYFIDNDDYFQQTPSDAVNQENFEDNDERMIFYSRGVLETVKKLRWSPDVVHCHGWISALAPIYIKKAYNDEPSFRNSKIVVSLYENNFEGNVNPNFKEKAIIDGIEPEDINIEDKDNIDYKQIAKIALDYTDGIIAHGNIDPEILEYAKSKNIPVIEYSNTPEFIEKCNELYDQVCEKQ